MTTQPSKPLTTAQQRQQNNRTSDGKYTTKQHSEADVDLLGVNPELEEFYQQASESIGADVYDFARRNAPKILSQRASRQDVMHSPDDLAQDAVLAMLEEVDKNGGGRIKNAKPWLNRVMQNRATRMREGQFHWPNSVAIRQYHEMINEREQREGTLLSEAEKDKLRQYMLDNWDTLNPGMTRDRPQPDFHRYYEKNTAIRLDGMTNDQGEDEGYTKEAFMLKNTRVSAQAEDTSVEAELDQAIVDVSRMGKTKLNDQQINSARIAAVRLFGDTAPPIKPSLSNEQARQLYKDMGSKGAKGVAQAAQAVEEWEQGEDNERTAALMAPFGGEEALSMQQQQQVINALTKHGRNTNHVDQMWSLAVHAARTTTADTSTDMNEGTEDVKEFSKA